MAKADPGATSLKIQRVGHRPPCGLERNETRTRDRELRRSLRGNQKLGRPAILHDHIRNEVEVRSMAGSVVLNDCMLSL